MKYQKWGNAMLNPDEHKQLVNDVNELWEELQKKAQKKYADSLKK